MHLVNTETLELWWNWDIETLRHWDIETLRHWQLVYFNHFVLQELFCTSCWLGRCRTVTSVTRIRLVERQRDVIRAMIDFVQILFMVGCGFLKPAMDKLRTDTPKALRRLLDNCLSHTRDVRPAFRNVLVSLENLMSSLPKIHRSLSEPILNRYMDKHGSFGYI